ncbi:MAG TPA: hypothetical protein VFP41_11425 [Actinomycetota bacterium]|nr:hypothetical protein [Actinomycetota bacterium]
MPTPVDCLIEAGSKRTFASAVAWPGWCRAGRDEDEALQALWSYGERYAQAMKASGVRFSAPRSSESFHVIERVAGNATTDFGAPDGVYDADDEPVPAREWTRARRVLEGCWAAFDGAAAAAEGIELRKGPRGGGRGLDAIVAHVVGAEAGYLRMLTGDTVEVDEADAWAGRLAERAALLEGLDRAKAGDLPERGPRGGKRWKPRRFLRRTAWHVLDHAWEIEDRRTG